MTEIPLGVSLTERDNEFLIARKQPDGIITEFPLTQAELIGLKALIENWSSRLLQSLQDKSGQVRPIISHPVAAGRCPAEC